MRIRKQSAKYFSGTHKGREAGLTQGALDPLGAELDRLRQEVVDHRREVAEAHATARSALARLEKAEHDLVLARLARDARLPLTILRRDPLPDLSAAELAARCAAPAEHTGNGAPA